MGNKDDSCVRTHLWKGEPVALPFFLTDVSDGTHIFYYFRKRID